MLSTYLALLEAEKTVIVKSSLELINAIPDPIKYLIKREFDSQVKARGIDVDLFSYTAVNLNGKFQPIEFQNFIVIDLGTDWAGRYVNERKVLIKEKRTNVIKEFHYVCSSDIQYITHHLVPIFNRLNSAGSWEALEKYEELDKVKEENKKLKSQMRELKEQLKILKEGVKITSELNVYKH
jgi:hypothetical protein